MNLMFKVRYFSLLLSLLLAACNAEKSGVVGGEYCSIATASTSDRWMGTLKNEYPQMANQKMNQFFWPGSHDTASYDFRTSLANPWARTQSFDFNTQLELGVRYFDLRISQAAGGFHFVHGDWDTIAGLDDLIDQLNSFFTFSEADRASEIVVLDFSHFSGFSQGSDYLGFMAQMLSDAGFANRLIKAIPDASDSTFEQVWSGGGNVIITMDGKSPALLGENKDYIWPDLITEKRNEWANTDSSSQLLSTLNTVLKNNPLGRDLWKLQGVLTPHAGSLTFPRLAEKANDVVFAELNPGSLWWEHTTILITDHYQCRFTDLAVKVNTHRLQSLAL